MGISDLSIRRPVFAIVLSLMLIVVGLVSLARLWQSVRELPDINPPIVSIDTNYRGASAQIVETKITQMIEERVAGVELIDKMRSSSSDERSRITVEFDLDRDIDSAANDVRDRVATPAGWYSAFREATWDEALSLAAQQILRIRDDYGPRGLGALS